MLDAALLELVARRETGLAGPDDDDVDLLGHPSTVAPLPGPVSRIPQAGWTYAVPPAPRASPRPIRTHSPPVE
ncbi:hypothetical protein GCM10009721_23060 [Terrabacter tumescens]|uniref:Uncharacterized protein n=1 Tax=Terrabacter tumescens TaxID=60443 RepID=A0ABQ2HZ76_9MICO|nr:hypothetical protein GCM10009721_23060 [Terrabacter tumescens]